MTDKHELSITRFIDAPPEAVYRVWTTRTGEWWAPRPFTTPVVDWDLRPGGRAFVQMRSPEGEDMPHDGVFLEVVPDRKVVFTNAFKAGWIPQILSGEGCDFAMVAVIGFEPEEAGTRYTARVRHWDEEALKRHEALGFQQGWMQCADQLAALAETELTQTAA